MTAKSCRLILRIALLALAATPLLAQTPPPAPPPGTPPSMLPPKSPVCARLEDQLNAFDRGIGDASRIEQIKRLEDAINKQQFELDRLVAQSHKAGCEGSGFFLFGGQPPQCEAINGQVQRARASLDRSQADMEALRRAGGDREGQRRALLVALAQNDCGQQYRAAAQAAQPRGFLETLFGGIPPLFNNNPITTPQSPDNVIPGLPGQTASGGYRTLCVRTCDGYYFPISYSVPQSKFLEDEKICQRQCPAAEVALYAHHNPGEDVNQAVSMQGRPYTELPTAFAYRKEYNSACSCRRPGESWAAALKNIDTRSTIESGDILVDDQRAKQMSMPKVDAQGRPIKLDLRGPKSDSKMPAMPGKPPENSTSSINDTPVEPRKGPVRSVGTPFLPER